MQLELYGFEIKIKSYFTITIDGLYLTGNITFVDIFDIPMYLTKYIVDIPDILLFNDYNEALRCEYEMLKRHYLLRKNCSVKIVEINKAEVVRYDR